MSRPAVLCRAVAAGVGHDRRSRRQWREKGQQWTGNVMESLFPALSHDALTCLYYDILLFFVSQ
ncbi:hypothetical protein DESPIG_01889 [Desulfovibrio piger ATCC 29098]|uniref:Uncharacterized protein n=1 Tax=Desulfovibrio piger ATCC 29098 TaxID=411464 RepID=B6WUX4_9BACT|nr:hypothetical protein DESPIG_01889 [Desulfovibrio piger ATCC 29098]